ncbi:MAG: SRPBCC domain-containing protein, partial [Chloroflexota bacterium]
MTEPSGRGARTRVSRIIHAPPKGIYEAFLDRDAVATWLPPDGMTGEVHTLDAHEGGAFRMSLTYQDPEHSPRGKTADDRDTVQGR